MCQSIAEGGARCAPHARAAAERAMGAYRIAYPRGCRVDPISRAEAIGAWVSPTLGASSHELPQPPEPISPSPHPRTVPRAGPASQSGSPIPSNSTPRVSSQRVPRAAPESVPSWRRPQRPARRSGSARAPSSVRRRALRRLGRQVGALGASLTPRWLSRPLRLVSTGWSVGRNIRQLIRGR